MSRTDDPRHRYQLAVNRLKGADVSEFDVTAIIEFLNAIDPAISTTNFVNGNGDHETKTYGTLAAYCQSLKRVAELSNQPLTEMPDAATVNGLFDSLGDGTHPEVKDDGYGSGTLVQWSSAASKFYEYHGYLGINSSDIVKPRQKKTSVDDRDMYSRAEIQQMRDAVSNTRDRCLLELLLNTGQRVRAIQTLRIKDVDVEEGVYYLNSDDLGLKGADKNGKKRPLLGAKRPVYDWLKDHPTGNPNDYLITCLPTANRGTPGAILSQSNIRIRLKIIAENAEVNKPPNPHNFRHYFVTTCKRDYGLDEATIKHLIGHGPDSTIMESTYQHLTDDDHIKTAEVVAGLREPNRESPLTPAVCPTCSESLESTWRSCPACGTPFTPDAQAVKQQSNKDLWESKGPAEDEEDNVVGQLKRLLDENPELLDDLARRAE